MSIAVAVALWQWSSYEFGIAQLFPPPSKVATSLVTLIWDGTLISATAYSLARIVAGFLLGGILGALIGLVMGTSRTVTAIFNPYIHFFRFIPVFAWFGPMLLWVGANEESKVILIGYATFFVVVINAMAGVSSIPADSLRMARAYGAGPIKRFRHVTVPATLPYVLVGFRLAIGNSFMTVIAAEFLQANDGLGFLLSSFQNFFNMPGIFSVIICLGALGFATDRLYVMAVSRWAWKYLPSGRLR